MNEKVINLGYTTYLKNDESKIKKRTGNLKSIINKHKILTICILIIVLCLAMNGMLIYNFIRILEQSRVL